MDIIDLLFESGHGPRRIDAAFTTKPTLRHAQEASSISNEQVPSEDVEQIMDDLTDDQLYSIRRQPVYILNELAQEDVTIDEQHPGFLRYDREGYKL